MRRFFGADRHPNDSPSDPDQAPAPFTRRVPPVGRRGLAWGLELAIVVIGIAAPVYGGIVYTQRAEQRASSAEVYLSPLLQTAQVTVAKTLGLPQRSLRETVTPLTHGLWSAALAVPVVLLGIHIYSLGRWGASGPKAWLRIQVVTLDGQMPTWRQSLLRDGVGKWGVPLAIAYGLWRVAGGFPNLLILAGLSALTLVLESATALLSRARRPWHDYLAGTCTVDPETGAIVRLTHQWQSEDTNTEDTNIKVQEALPSSPEGGAITWIEGESGLTTVVLNPAPTWPEQKPPRWRLLHPAAGLVLLLGLVGISAAGGYFLRGRTLAPPSDPTLFGQLVVTLTNPEADLDTKQAAILALGNTPDAQVTSLLVDLIAQADDPDWLDTLHQAILARGPAAVPHLRRLNQGLGRDLAGASDAAQKQRLVLRLQTVNQSLAKLIALEGDRIHTLDLRGLHLGYLSQGNREFLLALNKQNLAGIQWQGTRLNRAQLKGAIFFDPGPDQVANTYDDRIADLRGADLTDTDLTGANLTLAQLQGSGLLRANLTGANLTGTDLQRVNLERATLIQADLTGAHLSQARLTAADLTEAVLAAANLSKSRLRQLNATGAILVGANLRGAELQEAALADANLRAAILTDANLQGADLQGADLQGANLQNANLRYTTLQGVRWQRANLAGVDLQGAKLATAEVEASDGFVTAAPDLDAGQQLLGVDFSAARNLSPGQLNYICAQGGLHRACPSSP